MYGEAIPIKDDEDEAWTIEYNNKEYIISRTLVSFGDEPEYRSMEPADYLKMIGVNPLSPLRRLAAIPLTSIATEPVTQPTSDSESGITMTVHVGAIMSVIVCLGCALK